MTTAVSSRAGARPLTPQQGAVKMFFRGAWGGLFLGPMLYALLITALFFIGVGTHRDISIPGMDLTVAPNDNFQFLIDIRPLIVAAVVGAIVCGLAAAWYGYRRLAAEGAAPGDAADDVAAHRRRH